MKPSKKALKADLVSQLQATLETLEQAHAATREGATHEEAKPENDKDTRALEQSYLARGQAMRIEGLKAGLAAVGAMGIAAAQAVRVGCVVSLEDEDGEVLTYLLAPEGGGTKLKGGVLVLTPAAPLGAALVGKRAGDEVELRVAGKARQFTVRSVE